jgi:acyl-CoA synthetase (AMP-forming)/AMP-acid ligase II
MIFKSETPDVQWKDIPYHNLILAQAMERGDKPALIDGPSGRAVSYKQLVGGAMRMGANIAAKGFKKGDVFAIMLPNVPEYAIAFHGTLMAGGTVTTINPLYTAEEVAFQLNDTKAKFMLTIGMFLDKAKEAQEKSGIEEIFTLDGAEGSTPFMALMQEAGMPPKIEFDTDNDLVVLPYSSGTTGLPKGVMISHRNATYHMHQVDQLLEFEEGDNTLVVLPFFHIYGMMLLMNLPIMRGVTVVTMPRFDLEQFLELMQKYKIKGVGLVPPIILALAKHPIVDKYDLSNLEWIGSGAAPLDAELQKACAARLNCSVFQGYGMSETSAGIAISSVVENKIGASGKLIPGMEMKIVDYQTGQAVDGPNQTGEIWVRGINVMKGYLNRPEVNANTFDGEGWMHTGDIGYVDADGYLYIVDRIKELIKYKALQVAPAELEAILLTNPAIADAAVIGSPDEEAGEVPKAFVVKRSEISAEDIMAYVAEKVAPHKKIRLVEFVDAIPKSASGKILRRVLVEQERAKVGSN